MDKRPVNGRNDSGLDAENPLLGKLMFSFVFLGLALVVSGTNRCQEDYEFAAQADPSGSATPTDSSSATATPDDGITSSPTPTASDSETPEETATATATARATVTPTATTSTFLRERAVLKSLKDLSEPEEQSDAAASTDKKSGSSDVNSQGNWLGKSYSDQKVPGVSLDSDRDGFTDALEADSGSDPNDPRSLPPAPLSNLSLRLHGIDDDVDGLSKSDELVLGTDPALGDTDGDGVSDGAEVLSKTNPLKADNRPKDDDGDGLSNQYESDIGTSPRNADTDADGLRDDVELALSCNPLDNDSDKDGILDGKEVELQSDPTVPESVMLNK